MNRPPLRSVSRPIRYAVVGLGNIAQVAVLPAFEHARDTSRLVALVSSDPEKLNVLGDKYAVRHVGRYEQLEAVLHASHADAVYIALPNALHRSFTERAAALGRHVLCEKPMAPTFADAQAMVRATDAAGVKLMIAYRLHFEEGNLTALDRVRRGDIGEPHFFSSTFSQQVREGDIRTRRSMGGGALPDMGIYCVNAARSLFRAEPVEVMAMQVRGTDPRFRGADETTTAILAFPGGRMAQLTASQTSGDVSEYRIVGTRGDIRLEPAFDYSTELRQFVTVDGSTDSRSFRKRDQFAPELVHFSESILGDVPPEPSGEEGMCDVRVLEAIELSARTGQKVVLPAYERAVYPSLRQEMKLPAVGKVKTVHAPSPSK